MPTRNEGRRVSGREGGLILEWSASSRVGGRSRDVDVARQRRERVREKENLSPTCDGNARYRHIFYLM